MKTLAEEYSHSLKMPEVEEVVDRGLFRPVAFILVKLIYRTRVTPNQISFLSMISGLMSAWQFSKGTPDAAMWGGVWYAIANTLDCADGQLARLQQSGTPMGRVVDGIVDYINGVAIFVGIGVGRAAGGSAQWPLVVAAGVSSALHSVTFDRYQSVYLSIVRGNTASSAGEYDRYLGEVKRLREGGGNLIRRIAVRSYLIYLRVQSSFQKDPGTVISDPAIYRQYNRTMMHRWTFLGPSTNRSLLIIAAFAGYVSGFLWIVVTIGNLWLILCLHFQRRILRALRRDDPGSRSIPSANGA